MVIDNIEIIVLRKKRNLYCRSWIIINKNKSIYIYVESSHRDICLKKRINLNYFCLNVALNFRISNWNIAFYSANITFCLKHLFLARKSSGNNENVFEMMGPALTSQYTRQQKQTEILKTKKRKLSPLRSVVGDVGSTEYKKHYHCFHRPWFK